MRLAKINPHIRPSKSRRDNLDSRELLKAIYEGDRFALAKALTILESEKKEDQEKAFDLIQNVRKPAEPAIRIGITGPPGVGKSTLIEALGKHLLEAGHNLAVLAVDPSSQSSGGSILGDKTRMPILSQSKQAFIRPSPSGKNLGGVARKTRESIFLFESASYNPVIVETVGVGQSEVSVASMTDIFILVIPPGGGDEIQGIKRGIMELADIIIINKTDGKLKEQALETKNQYEHAVHLLSPRPHGATTKIFALSSIEAIGIGELWEHIKDLHQRFLQNNYLSDNRIKQELKWFEDFIQQSFYEKLFSIPEIKEKYITLKNDVLAGNKSPFIAADQFLMQLSDGFKE